MVAQFVGCSIKEEVLPGNLDVLACLADPGPKESKVLLAILAREDIPACLDRLDMTVIREEEEKRETEEQSDMVFLATLAFLALLVSAVPLDSEEMGKEEPAVSLDHEVHQARLECKE